MMVKWRKNWAKDDKEHIFNYEKNYLYIVSKFILYNEGWFIFLSRNYENALKCFNRNINELDEGYGLILYRCQYDKEYDILNQGDELKYVIKDYGGDIKDMTEEWNYNKN